MAALYILLGIIIFFFIALIINNYVQKSRGNTHTNKVHDPLIKLPKTPEEECCGKHETCEKDSLIAAFAAQVEYYDDEELDRFANKPSDTYTPEEVDEFREIFYTVLDEEKPRWIRSLSMRLIAVPDEMKDEILMVVSDLRSTKTGKK
jgi:succinate dehydrogenase flavin-adding protein (antitoxin of CptAB toxin-antitoxin module)